MWIDMTHPRFVQWFRAASPEVQSDVERAYESARGHADYKSDHRNGDYFLRTAAMRHAADRHGYRYGI